MPNGLTNEIVESVFLTLSIWQDTLPSYSSIQLHQQPDEQSWSIGQVCIHLINQTVGYNIPQIIICNSNNDHAEKTKTEEGETFFSRIRFQRSD
jgi:hypothetical protein